jgi:hypothetical protein
LDVKPKATIMRGCQSAAQISEKPVAALLGARVPRLSGSSRRARGAHFLDMMQREGMVLSGDGNYRMRQGNHHTWQAKGCATLRLPGVLLVSALISAAQIPVQNAAQLRGVLLERDAQTDGGEFSVRTAGNQVVRYRFDAKTYVEREEMPIDVLRLRPGEKVEVLSDPLSGSLLRYARTIHAIDPAPPPRAATRPGSKLDPALGPAFSPGLGLPHEPLFPRGDMTFSGVVSRLSDGRLVLRTRSAGEQIFLLRQDTRFVADGEKVPAAELKTNMRVFVRAGKDVFGHVEAYQVVWGGILLPPEL